MNVIQSPYQWNFLKVVIFFFNLPNSFSMEKQKAVLETKTYQESFNEQKRIQKQHGKFLIPTLVFPLFSEISPFLYPPHPENNASDLKTGEGQ